MIPGFVHFIYITEPGNPPAEFSLYHYLAVKSANVVNNPSGIYFHYNIEPSGKWWQKIKELVILREVVPPDEIFGNKLYHPAHKSDVLRLRILHEMGGIYLDLDTICVRSWNALLDNHFVMGEELRPAYVPKNWRQRLKYRLGLVKDETKQRIVCNAVLMSEQKSEFAQLWLEQYRSFRSKGKDKYWNEHSGKLSMALATINKDKVRIESPYSFHYPLYKPEQLKLLFEEVHQFPEAYIHHLWESHSREKYLSELTEDYIRKVDTTYNLIARRFL